MMRIAFQIVHRPRIPDSGCHNIRSPLIKLCNTLDCVHVQTAIQVDSPGRSYIFWECRLSRPFYQLLWDINPYTPMIYHFSFFLHFFGSQGLKERIRRKHPETPIRLHCTNIFNWIDRHGNSRTCPALRRYSTKEDHQHRQPWFSMESYTQGIRSHCNLKRSRDTH